MSGFTCLHNHLKTGSSSQVGSHSDQKFSKGLQTAHVYHHTHSQVRQVLTGWTDPKIVDVKQDRAVGSWFQVTGPRTQNTALHNNKTSCFSL